MSDKNSNKHGAKNTVLFNGLLYQIFKKGKEKGKKTTHILAYSKIRCQGLHSLESKIIYPLSYQKIFKS